jgi:hypothetical protein
MKFCAFAKYAAENFAPLPNMHHETLRLRREVLTPFPAFLGGPLTQKKGKLENRGLSCYSFSEILQISEKVWFETHQ